MKHTKVDRSFLTIVLLLVFSGFFIFASAALGLAARGEINYLSTISNQFILGVVGGLVVMFFFSKIDHNWIKRYAMLFWIASLVLTFAVFIPGLGFTHGGSTRWISLGALSFQPSELLKIATIAFLASWFNLHKKKITEPLWGLGSLLGILFITAIPLLLQPDFDVIILITIPAILMFLAAKGPFKHALIVGVISILILAIAGLSFGHVRSRIMGYFNPAENGQTINYQTQQSLIAIGSGELTGKGFGKSIQKFKYLPEPTGDSIFAVYGEEFGFLGTILLVILYSIFAVKGYLIAARSNKMFPSLFVIGIITLFITQSFANIASMVGLVPILGLPLVFVSHGGTSLLVSLAAMGIVLNISREGRGKGF